MNQEEADKTHPGFTITCDKCQSTLVYVSNDLGFSAQSGGWGSVDLNCEQCGSFVTVVESN